MIDSRIELNKGSIAQYGCGLNQERILIVLGHYGHMGGAERQAFHLIEWLRKHSIDVSVLGWTRPGPLTQDLEGLGCKCFIYPYSPKTGRIQKLSVLAGLAWFIRTRIQPDIILPFVSIHSKPLCTVWRYTGAKYCWWNQQDEGRQLFGSAGEKRALLNASDITSNSHVGAAFISQTYRIPIERIKVYNNGTPLPCLEDLRSRVSCSISWRQQLQLKDSEKLAVMLANITEYKDHETLLNAWALVRDACEGQGRCAPRLALAGTTFDTGRLTALKSLAFDLNLSDCVSFLGPVQDTNQLLFESDLVVHSSIKEGCPNAVCEAMAVGRCVIATDISGCRQALGVEREENLATPKDPVDFARKIVAMLVDDKKRVEVGMANRRRIENEFTVEQMVEFFLDAVTRRLPTGQ